MSVFAPMMGATALTGIRVVASPSRSTGQLSRVIVAGTIATAALATLETIRPAEASGLATVVFITAFLIHGVALAQLATRAANLDLSPTPT